MHSKFRVNPSVHVSDSQFSTQRSSSFQIEQITAEDITTRAEREYEKRYAQKEPRSNITFHWRSLEEARAWITEEEENHCFNFSMKSTITNKNPSTDWYQKQTLVCSRNASGGAKSYTPKKGWARKKPPKHTGCKCRLTLTTYPDSKAVTGNYHPQHNHELGAENARFTSISSKTRKEIEGMLRMGIDPNKVLEHVRGRIYDDSINTSEDFDTVSRAEFISRADIRRIEKIIEQEAIRLATEDGPSVLKWVENLKKNGHFVFLKASNQPSPPGASLEPNAFVLIIQTRYQQQCWVNHGGRFAGIDATHNTTHYENMNLYTLLVRDRWGHGVPAAWMISSNAQEETVGLFLSNMRNRFPNVVPSFFMSDKNHPQLKSIKRYYPESKLLLCWWHVLHAWQQHFRIPDHPQLWELLKKWIRVTSHTEFDEMWAKIQKISPADFTNYLKTYWMDDISLWSALYRTERSIFQNCDTNMLVEAWHHLLKGKFMQGKRNRRLDHLIYILVKEAVPYFMHKHQAQLRGFEGPDLEVQERLRIEKAARTIREEDIVQSVQDPLQFRIASQSSPGVFYTVDLEAYECTCLSFPKISMCKHIFAVQLQFSELCEPISCSNLSITLDSQSATQAIPETGHLPTPTDSEQQMLAKSIISRLSSVVCSLKDIPPSEIDLVALHNFSSSIETFTSTLAAFTTESLLPKARKVAPNQNSWSETEAVMGVKVKAKRKLQYEAGGYSGGERSGKKTRKSAATPSTCQRLGSTGSTPAPTATCTTSSNGFIFNPATFDVYNLPALQQLNPYQLALLCQRFNLPTHGTGSELFERLYNHVEISRAYWASQSIYRQV